MDQLATPDTKNKDMTTEEKMAMEGMVTEMAEMGEMLKEMNVMKAEIAEFKRKRELALLETAQYQKQTLDMRMKQDEMRLGNIELVSHRNIY